MSKKAGGFVALDELQCVEFNLNMTTNCNLLALIHFGKPLILLVFSTFFGFFTFFSSHVGWMSYCRLSCTTQRPNPKTPETMKTTNQLTEMKTKIVEMEPVRLPDGMLMLSFQILNSNGARIGKVCGDLNEETATEIRVRAAVEALRLGNRISGYAPKCVGYPV